MKKVLALVFLIVIVLVGMTVLDRKNLLGGPFRNQQEMTTPTQEQTLTNKTLGSGTLINTGEYDVGQTVSSTQAIDWSNGLNQGFKMTASTTLTFANPLSGSKYLLRIEQGGSGSNVITWPAVEWAGAAAPTLSTSVGDVDIVTIYYSTSTYYGSASLNFD